MKRPPTARQQEQRDIAWLLFLTEGYIAAANYRHRIAFYTSTPRVVKAMERAVNEAVMTSVRLRAELDRMAGQLK